MVKVTFRLGRPQSQVVRESIREYEARSDKLGEEERQRLLAIMHRIMKAPPTRPQAGVDTELREIRAARRRWPRRRP